MSDVLECVGVCLSVSKCVCVCVCVNVCMCLKVLNMFEFECV